MPPPATIELPLPTYEKLQTIAQRRHQPIEVDKHAAIDPLTGEEVPLFNPRQQIWPEHFRWDADGLYVEGLTTVGRATVAALDMNNAYIVRTRRLWIQWGVHPPV